MLIPIIETFIKEVNSLAGEPNAPSFGEELTYCSIVMANETNPVDLGYKFAMLNISLSIMRKILTYLSLLQLRSDSLQTSKGEPIDQVALNLAVRGITNAIEREEEPLEVSLRRIRAGQSFSSSTNNQPVMENVSSGDEPLNNNNNHSHSPTNKSPSPIPSTSRGITRKSPGSQMEPGTSRQSKIAKQSPQSDSDDSPLGKHKSKLLTPTRTRGLRSAGRRGRISSVSSASSVSSTSTFSFSPTSPSSEARPDQKFKIELVVTPPVSSSMFTEPLMLSPSTRSLVPIAVPPSSTLSPSPSGSHTVSSDEFTYGLTVSFGVPVSIPIQQGLVRVLCPHRDKIETTPICGMHIFIKLISKKDVYFLKRQIEILTRLSPRIVVTKFSRYQLEVPKSLAPTVKVFVDLNSSVLKGEYYVYTRPSLDEPNETVFIEILANTECQQSIENSSRFFNISAVVNRQAVTLECYKECGRCFFCYDDAHTECSHACLMSNSPKTSSTPEN